MRTRAHPGLVVILVEDVLERGHERWDDLLLAAHHARQYGHPVLGFDLEGAFHDLVGAVAKVEQLGRLGLHVSEHVEDHRELLGLGGLGKPRPHERLGGLAAVVGHVRTLAHAKLDVATREDLEVLVEDLLGGASGEVGSRLEHGVGVRGDVHLAYPREGLGRGLVLWRAGGRAEHERVGQDRREHEAGDVGGNLDPLLVEDVKENRGRATYGHVAEHDRPGRLDAADAVMVDDLHDLGLVEPLDRLGALVVVHEDDVLLLDVQHVG